MKASKDGKFSLELPDGTPILEFMRAMTGLLTDSTVKSTEESDEYDTYLLDLEALFHIGSQPSRRASFQEIRNRAKQLFAKVNVFRVMLAEQSVVFARDFEGDSATLDNVAMRLRNQEDADNKKFWLFALINNLIDLADIDLPPGGKTNEQVAVQATERLKALKDGVKRLRDASAPSVKYVVGHSGDLAALAYAEERLRAARRPKRRR